MHAAIHAEPHPSLFLHVTQGTWRDHSTREASVVVSCLTISAIMSSGEHSQTPTTPSPILRRPSSQQRQSTSSRTPVFAPLPRRQSTQDRINQILEVRAPLFLSSARDPTNFAPYHWVHAPCPTKTGAKARLGNSSGTVHC